MPFQTGGTKYLPSKLKRKLSDLEEKGRMFLSFLKWTDFLQIDVSCSLIAEFKIFCWQSIYVKTNLPS